MSEQAVKGSGNSVAIVAIAAIFILVIAAVFFFATREEESPAAPAAAESPAIQFELQSDEGSIKYNSDE